MAFFDWLMYCLAYELQGLLGQGPLLLLFMLKLLSMLAFGLTLCCLLSLPLSWLELNHHRSD
jgi:hypothetical protein